MKNSPSLFQQQPAATRSTQTPPGGSESRAEEQEAKRLRSMQRYERTLWESGVARVAGVDEAGVGPLAGPVVAAAVIFKAGVTIAGVDDSKRLTSHTRHRLAKEIRRHSLSFGIGMASVEEISALNIYYAALLAMQRAVGDLAVRPDYVLVDGRTIPDLDLPQTRLPKGDRISFSIAAASILAKTRRDAVMLDLDGEFPEYGFARHKGYPTPQHQKALLKFGACRVHRHSFEAVREFCGDYSPGFYRLRDAVLACSTQQELNRLTDTIHGAQGRFSSQELRKLKLLLKQQKKRY